MSELLNLIGLSTGVALYAMLLTMVVWAHRAPSARQFDPVLLATALLGLVWNLCALPAYELPKVGIVGPFPWLVAIGFGALGFLPAAVVHSVLRQGPTGIQGASPPIARNRGVFRERRCPFAPVPRGWKRSDGPIGHWRCSC